MVNAKYTIPALIVVFGGGLAYWVISNRDTTPVGLTIVKRIDNVGGYLGEDADSNQYEMSFVTGTWKATDSSLPVVSVSEDAPILVVFKNGEPVKGEIVKLDEWKLGEDNYEDESQAQEFFLNQMKMQVKLMKEFDIDTSTLEEQIDFMENRATAEAESIFGPTMTLQSHFVW